MGRMIITNISNFLDEEGALLNTLSATSRKLLHHLKNIIQYVNTPTPCEGLSPQILCWSAPYKKRCKGKIDASLEVENLHIHWHCLVCGNHGVIIHWKKLERSSF